MNFIHMFHLIDADHSGEISKEELISFMHANNFNEDFVDKWLNLFDLNQRGRITIDDYCERLGLEIDERISKKFKKPRPSVINLDDLDEFVDIDETMEQHVVHVSTNKPLATSTKRSSNIKTLVNSDNKINNDKEENLEDVTEDIIVKKTAHMIYEGLPYNENDSPKKPKDEDRFIDLSESFSNFLSNLRSISLPKQVSDNDKKKDNEKTTEKKKNERDEKQSLSPFQMFLSKLKHGGTSPKSQSHFTFGKSTNTKDESLKDEPFSENLDKFNSKNKFIDTLNKDNNYGTNYEFNDKWEILDYNNSQNTTPEFETINEYQSENTNNIENKIFDPRPVMEKSMSNDFAFHTEENEDNILTQKIVNIENNKKPTYNLLYKNNKEFKTDPNTDLIKSKSIEPLQRVVANDTSFESNLKESTEKDEMFLHGEMNDSVISNRNISIESDQSKEKSYFPNIIPKLKTGLYSDPLEVDDQLYYKNDENDLTSEMLHKRDLDHMRIKNNEPKFLEKEREFFHDNTLSLTNPLSPMQNNNPRMDINDPFTDTVKMTNQELSKTFLKTFPNFDPKELNELILNKNKSMELRSSSKNEKIADEIKKALNQGKASEDLTTQKEDLQNSVQNTKEQNEFSIDNKRLYKDQEQENIFETYKRYNLKEEYKIDLEGKIHSKDNPEINDFVDSPLKEGQKDMNNDPGNKSRTLKRHISEENQNVQENTNYFKNDEYTDQELIDDIAIASSNEDNYDKKRMIKKHKSEIIFSNPLSLIDPDNETITVNNLHSVINASTRNIKDRSLNTPESSQFPVSQNNDLREHFIEPSGLGHTRIKDSDDISLPIEQPYYKGLSNDELKQNKYFSHLNNQDDKNISQTNSNVIKRDKNIKVNDENMKDVLHDDIVNEDFIEEKINIQSSAPLNQSPKSMDNFRNSSLTTENDNTKEKSFQYVFIKGVKSQRNFKIIYRDIEEDILSTLISDVVNIFEEVNDNQILNLTERIKTFLDDNYDKVWHVILTDDEYQLYLTYEKIIIFQYDTFTFLVWKTI